MTFSEDLLKAQKTYSEWKTEQRKRSYRDADQAVEDYFFLRIMRLNELDMLNPSKRSDKL